MCKFKKKARNNNSTEQKKCIGAEVGRERVSGTKDYLKASGSAWMKRRT